MLKLYARSLGFTLSCTYNAVSNETSLLSIHGNAKPRECRTRLTSPRSLLFFHSFGFYKHARIPDVLTSTVYVASVAYSYLFKV